MRIDVHTHAYPPEIASDPIHWAKAMKEPHWALLHCPDDGKTLHSWRTIEQHLDDMESAHIDHAVLLGWYWENEESAQQQNAYYAKLISKHTSKLSAFCALNPSSANAFQRLKEHHKQGFKGIGELHPPVQGYKLSDSACQPIWAYAQEHGLLINLHVTEPIGRPHAGRIASDFEDILWLAKSYPNLRIILAHLGGLLPFYELNPYVRKHLSNVYYDTAANPLLYEDSVIEKIVSVVGTERILYGSDYPLRSVPKKQLHGDLKTPLRQLYLLIFRQKTCTLLQVQTLPSYWTCRNT